ncbi:MAG: hypothetical protein KC486_15550 [Myxococcales bacterium]|nr:hypothetical protein [Myxococcales bacterium]
MAESDESAGAGRRKLWIAGLVIAAVHLSLVAYAFPAEVVFGDAGFNKPDYHTHWQQAQVLLELYRETGRLWAYDPGLLAGHPVGLFFDVDNKLHFLWVLALTRLGVGAAAAFNLFAVASSLLAPLSLAGAARLLGYRAPAILAVAGVTVLLWNFDSTLHFLWTAGMLSFATACHLALLCVGLMWAMLRGRRPWLAFAGLAVALPLAHLTHVWAFAILVVPLVGLYLGHARRLDLAGHLRVWLAVAATLAVNAYWLLPALRHLDWLTESAVVGQATPLYLVADYLEVLVNPVNTGYAEPRTLFRFAALLGAAATLVNWRRRRDPRFAVCASTLAWLVGMSYFGTFIPLLKLTEPYRFASSATLLAGLLAAPWLVEHVRPATLRRLSGPARGLVALLVLLVVPRIFSEVTTFVPELQKPLLEGTAIDHRGARVPTPIHSMRLPAVDDHLKSLARHLDELPGDGRVLVQLWPVGEYLRGALRRPVIGGFPDRRVIHEAANLFRLRPDEPRYYGDELGAYLERYHIDYVVFSPPFFPEIERRLDLLEPVRVFGFHKIFHVRRPSTYVVGGRATIDAGFDRIAVRDARADDGRSLVLRFHYMEGMTCAPDCTIERAPIPHDPVGFIRVAAAGESGLPASFVIRREDR